jgi:hypothetical protein
VANEGSVQLAILLDRRALLGQTAEIHAELRQASGQFFARPPILERLRVARLLFHTPELDLYPLRELFLLQRRHLVDESLRNTENHHAHESQDQDNAARTHWLQYFGLEGNQTQETRREADQPRQGLNRFFRRLTHGSRSIQNKLSNL